jgi:hypothetical protein
MITIPLFNSILDTGLLIPDTGILISETYLKTGENFYGFL